MTTMFKPQQTARDALHSLLWTRLSETLHKLKSAIFVFVPFNQVSKKVVRRSESYLSTVKLFDILWHRRCKA
jgi:hypothetical protein